MEVTENPVVCNSCEASLYSFASLITSWSVAINWNDDDITKEDYEGYEVKKESGDEFSDSNTNSSIGIVNNSDSAKTGNGRAKRKKTNAQIKSDDLSDSCESVNVKTKKIKSEDEDSEMEDMQLKNEEVDIKPDDEAG